MAPPRHIGFEIASISNLIKRHGHKHPPEFRKYTRMQMWIIGYIRERTSSEDVFQGELEREFKMTRATASDILKRMERDGLITRESVSHDGRRKKITLTPEAIRVSEDVRRNIDEKEKLMARGISPEELEVFFTVVDKIKKNLSGTD